MVAFMGAAGLGSKGKAQEGTALRLCHHRLRGTERDTLESLC